MRVKISLKTLLRTPFKTLLMFMLVAAATFALFSRAAEYAITSRELDRAASFYRGLASLDNGLPDTTDAVSVGMLSREHDYEKAQPLTNEQIEAFASLPQVTTADARYMTAGFSEDGYARLDISGDGSYNYTTRFIAEGTYLPLPDEFGEAGRTEFRLYNSTLLAGDPVLVELSPHLRIQHWEEDGGSIWIGSGSSGEAGRLYYYIVDNPYGKKWRDSLTEGERCLIIGRYEPRGMSSAKPAYIGDMDTLDYLSSFWRLEDLPENYLELDAFAPVRELIEITNNDLRAFDMVYTSDLLSVPRFAERDMVIAEGRALTPEDDGTANCVVSQQFFKKYKLNIGDTVTMNLGGRLFEQNAALGAVACIPERYSPPVETAELTIVGVYRDVDPIGNRQKNAYMAYSVNTIFAPLSLLPVDVPDDHAYTPGEYSFVIDNARDSAAFLDRAETLAEELGLTLRFNDGGWSRVEESFETGQRMSFLTVALFVVAAAAALLMALWLFIRRGRKTYAIMRALGATRAKARNSLLFPFAFICVLAVPAGAAVGLNSTARAVMPVLENIAQAAEDYSPDAALPVTTIAVCLVCELAFLTALAALFMYSLGRTQPLSLLQANAGERAVAAVQPPPLAAQPVTDVFTGEPLFESETPERGGKRYTAFEHVWLYVLRHMSRSRWKATLTLLLTVLMCGAMGTLTVTRQAYRELYESTETKAYLTHAASFKIEEAVKSELFSDVYYKNNFIAQINAYYGFGFLLDFTADARSLVVTNDPERFLSDAGVDFTASYLEGFDGRLEEIMIGDNYCVLGADAARELGLSLGDKVQVSGKSDWNFFWQHMDNVQYPNGPPENEWQLDFYNSRIKSEKEESSGTYTVGGIIDCPEYGTSVFAPVGSRVKKILGLNRISNRNVYSVEYSEFVAADNDRLEEVTEQLEDYAMHSRWVNTQSALTIDSSERDNIAETLMLIDTLFPYAVAAAVIIGAIAPILILLLSTKEAAIMRILGTTKKRARAMLALEHVGLCVLGVALAAGGLAVYNIGLMTRSAETLMICGALYTAGYVIAVAAAVVSMTSRKPMDLLQVKE